MNDQATPEDDDSISAALRGGAMRLASRNSERVSLFGSEHDAYQRLPASLAIVHMAAIGVLGHVAELRASANASSPFFLFDFELLLCDYRTLNAGIPIIEDEFCAVANGVAEWEGYVFPSWHNMLRELGWAYVDAAFMSVPRSLADGTPGENAIWRKWQYNWESITQDDMSLNVEKFRAALLECKFPTKDEHKRINALLQQEAFRAAQLRLVTKRKLKIDPKIKDYKPGPPTREYFVSIFLDDGDDPAAGDPDAHDGPIVERRFTWAGKSHHVPKTRWNMLHFLWDKPQGVTDIELGSELWGEEWDPSKISTTANRLNSDLRKTPWRVRQQGGRVFLYRD